MNQELMNKPWVCVNDETGKVTIIPQKLYIYLKENFNFVLDVNGNIYRFDQTHYKKMSMSELRSFVKSFLPARYRTKKHWDAVIDELTSDFSGTREADFNSDENIIVFTNGVLDLTNGELVQHDPKYLVSRIVDAPYLEENINTPIFNQFLDDLLPNDDPTRTFLWEFIGAILSNVKGWRYKKMLLLVGDGNTGKSKLRELVSMLLGNEYCMSIDLKKLNERFGSSTIYGRRLAGSGDMSYMRVNEMAVAKEITGGDLIFAEHKGKDAFSFRYDGFVWCNCNRLPFFGGDKGKHVYERFAIIECHNVIPEDKRDPNLLEKLYTEKDAIINTAIHYFLDSVKRGYRFIESEDMQINRELYIRDNNTLFTFVAERCSTNVKGKRTLRSRFNELYKEWCKDNDLTPERPKEIGELLHNQFGITVKKSDGLYYYDELVVYGEDFGSDDPNAPDGDVIEEIMKDFNIQYKQKHCKQ